MKSNSPFDDHIKKQFSNYNPDVPIHIWGNIVAGKNKKRRGGFWLSFMNRNGLLILVGILLLGGGLLIYKTMAHNQEISSSANNELKTGTHTTNPSIPVAEKNTVITKQQNEKAKNITADYNKITAPAVSSHKKNTTEFKNIESVTGDNSPEMNDAQKHTGFLKRPKKLKGKTSMSFKSPEDITKDSQPENGYADVALLTDELLLKRLILNISPLKLERMQPAIKKINNLSLNIPCPRTEKNAAGNKKYIEIYGGADYAFRSLKDTANSVYLAKRKESSRFSSAFSAGIRYTKVFNNGMSFRTGVNYSQINEKFKYFQGNIIQVVYITNNNGDTTGSFTTSGTRYKTTYNKFRTIDLPVVFGYEVGNGRLRANFNTGVMINIYSWQKGDVLDTAYKPVSITTGKGSSPYQFKTNAGIGFVGAVSVYYKLSNHLHFLAEPYFRYNFSPASKSELTLKQKYSTAGLRLGLRFDF